MIISASRRTDIPAFYSEWLINRLRAGWALVPIPRRPRQYRKIPLSSDLVDAIVFWTKNPIPMKQRLGELEAMGCPFYFQFTLTPYDCRLEPNLPPKTELIQAFQQLGRSLGKERLVWRYDPVILQGGLTLNYHRKAFAALAEQLSGYTQECIISFLDLYGRRMPGGKGAADRELTHNEMEAVAAAFAETAARYGLQLSTCAEAIPLERLGIRHASCIDPIRIERLLGCPVVQKKDTGQRPSCGCIQSVDIGTYHTCGNGCVYCYATSSFAAAQNNLRRHSPESPMLVGWPSSEDIILEQRLESIKIEQTSLF